MRHVSLFSGIGGFDLAADWMGWENVAHCERDSFCQKVLRYYWPLTEMFTDITKSDFRHLHGTIDIISGGFPCQPYSSAGKRRGKDDPRHLWPEMLRAIREIAPRWVVGENVRGITDWNGGVVFHEVQTDLEVAGYEVLPFILPAASVGAPHRRDRVWFVAHRYGGTKGSPGESGEAKSHGGEDYDEQESGGVAGELYYGRGDVLRPASHPTSGGRKEWEQGGGWPNGSEDGARLVAESKRHGSQPNATDTPGGRRVQNHGEPDTEQPAQRIPDWREFPTQSPVCSGNDGLPARLDGITVSRHRRESIKAAGNAIVPQVAYQIFKAIAAM